MAPRPAVLVPFALLALVPLAPALGGAFPDPVPCGDARGCPDLVVDPAKLQIGLQRVETFPPTHCAVREGMVPAGARHVLRFTFDTPNIGAGDLIVGDPADHPEWFTYSTCHRHFHFREYADYRLWVPDGWLAYEQLRKDNPTWTAQDTLANHPELLASFVKQDKRGFCVIDVVPADPTPQGWVPPEERRHEDCDDQGITRGWADEYIFLLDGQWIDVTGTAPGLYMLEAEVNAERLYVESDYTNNRAAMPVLVTP